MKTDARGKGMAGKTASRRRVAARLREIRVRREYAALFAVMAVIVSLGVAAALMQGGVAATREELVLDCPYKGAGAHTHGEGCYDADGNLVCPLEERELHTHGDSCYEEALTCGLDGAEGHEHTDACYERTLVCGLEEVTEEHVHGPGCFRSVTVDDGEPAGDEADGLVSSSEDAESGAEDAGEGDQADDGEDAGEGDQADDGEDSGEGDQADDGTGDVAGTDGDDQAGDLTADSDGDDPADDGIEDGGEPAPGEDGEQSFPEQSFFHEFKRKDGTLVLRVDVTAPEGALPEGARMRAEWVSPADMTSKQQAAVEEAVADRSDGRIVEQQAVDITFLDAAGNEVEPAQKVAVTFTSALAGTQDQPVLVHLEDLTEDQLAEQERALEQGKDIDQAEPDRSAQAVDQLGDADLGRLGMTLGDDQLAFESDDFSTYVLAVATLGHTLAAEGETMGITVEAPAEAGIPATAELRVSEVDPKSREYEAYAAHAAERLDADKHEVAFARFFDIKVVDGEQEVELGAPVQVRLGVTDAPADPTAQASVLHYDGEGEPELVDSEEDGGTAEFQADGFSVWGVVYTVDFHWEANGESYEFGIPGGGFASLSDLVEALGVVKDDASTEADEVGEFVAAVEKAEFSDPSLVWVGRAEDETTVGDIKKANKLDVRHSAELTKEQIEEIDAQIIKAGDWALISLRPFSTEETLTVTMSNGDQFAIKVTDAQLKKTVISASGKSYEVIVTYDDNAQIPEDASLEITEFAEGSKEYKAAREAVVDKKQSEDPAFDEKEFGVAAFDLTIVDKDGKQVEPKAAVDVSIKMKSLPEEAVEKDTQHSIEIHHLNESSGDVVVETVASAIDGSIKVEEAAQADFQLESFSTFTISWSGNTSNTYTTLRWTYNNNWNQTAGRVNVRVNYVDQNGNAISRPSTIGWTVDQWVGDNGEVNVNLAEALAKDIPGYTFTRAYVSNGGTQSTVTNAVGKTEGGWGWRNNTLRLYDGYSEVYSNGNYNNQNSYDAPNNLLYLEYSGGPHTTVHYGYMDGDTFVEFEDQPSPTNTSTSFGWAHLIYDFAGTDDKGLPVDWKYSGTYYHTSETTNPVQSSAAIQPLLRYYNNAWRYYNGDISTQTATRTNSNWKAVADDSDIYVVYEKPVITTGGSPTLKQNAQLPDAPNILKESVENSDGTNTLSLSVTGSRAPMDAEKVADVIVILDLSSSMRRDIGSNTAYDNNYQTVTSSRYYQAKQAVQNLANELYGQNGVDGQQYRMGLITFSNYAGRTYLTPTADKDVFQGELDAITKYEGSGTNWEHALQLANQMSVASDRATYIVFVTDGEPSVRQTRGNLTNEQLSGVNWTSNPADEGDIYHGGLSGGQFFPNNNDGTTPDFRDYLGSATFGGLMNNDVWDPRNRNAAVDEVASMVGHNKGFYAIGVSRDVNYLGDFVQSAGVDLDHYKLVTSGETFAEAIEDILNDLNGLSGQSDVRMFDGITDLTQTISKVNQEENRLIGADGNFTYWKSNPPQATWDEVKATWTNEQKEGFASGVANAGQTGKPADYATWSEAKKATYELGKQSVATSTQTAKTPADLWAKVWRTWDKQLKDAYNAGVEYIGSNDTPEGYSGWSDEKKAAYAIGKKVTFSEWTTREADGCAPAVYNTQSGAVEWNMGETFMLEDGITYKVSFICWPSQEAYDIIAKLNNGTITFGDLDVYPQEVWDQFEGNATDGYTLKTNEEHANTRYKSATSVSGNVTPGDEQPPLEFQHVPPMPLDKDKLNVGKTWEASRIDSVTPESVVLQVVGGNELYKQFEIEPTEAVGDSTANNYGRSENIYISCGHIKVDREHGTVVVYESGHDFTLREVEENSRHWDLDASVCRPMKINKVETMLVLVDNANVPAGMTSDKDYYASGNDEYYRLDGKVYKDTKAWADITGMNTRRSFLDLAKEVLVNNKVWAGEASEKFTYKITINVDPTTLSWDPGIEKYIIISIRGNGYSPAAAVADQTYPTTAVLPSQSGMDPSLIHDHYDDLYLVAESGHEFYLSIKNGWSVRFLNLPVGTTYSIEEVLPGDSNYDFKNARLEVRTDSSSDPEIAATNTENTTMSGSIEETSTLYKVVYQNDAKAKEVQILKTGQDATTPLGGAKFNLYTESAYTSNPQGTPYKTNLVSSEQTSTKGKIDLGELPIGKYYLVETKAPDGYNMRTDPVVITVSKTSVTYDDGTTLSQSGSGISQIEGAYQLTVTNDEGVALPSTGGPGTRLFTILGVILILGAGVLLWRRRRLI